MFQYKKINLNLEKNLPRELPHFLIGRRLKKKNCLYYL